MDREKTEVDVCRSAGKRVQERTEKSAHQQEEDDNATHQEGQVVSYRQELHFFCHEDHEVWVTYFRKPRTPETYRRVAKWVLKDWGARRRRAGLFLLNHIRGRETGQSGDFNTQSPGMTCLKVEEFTAWEISVFITLSLIYGLLHVIF